MTTPKEPPTGCQVIPGFLVELGNHAWLAQAGHTTYVWSFRGIWPTQAEAEEAKEKFCKTLPE